MSDARLQEYAAFADRLADAARSETLPRFRRGVSIENKASLAFDPVTDADREAERVIRDMIRSMYPAHGIIGEEFGSHDPGAAWRWVLDPVDGTRAFVCGVASWATLIALEESGAPVLGVIDQPFTDERWVGRDGATFYRRSGREMRCRTSATTKIAEARISTTDPRTKAYFNESEGARFRRVCDEARLARFSLDAYAYALLALGELDLVVETGLKRYDWSALVPVIKGAGGLVTAWSGEPLGSDARGTIVAAGTPALHEAALEALRD